MWVWDQGHKHYLFIFISISSFSAAIRPWGGSLILLSFSSTLSEELELGLCRLDVTERLSSIIFSSNASQYNTRAFWYQRWCSSALLVHHERRPPSIFHYSPTYKTIERSTKKDISTSIRLTTFLLPSQNYILILGCDYCYFYRSYDLHHVVTLLH